MKPPDEVRREFVAQWLFKAEDDLALLRHILLNSEPFLNAAAFHAQQATKKFLKKRALPLWHLCSLPNE